MHRGMCYGVVAAVLFSGVTGHAGSAMETLVAGDMTLRVDTQTGTVHDLRRGDKFLVKDNTLPLLRAALIETATPAGREDFLPDAVEYAADYKVDAVRRLTTPAGDSVEVLGSLSFPDNDRIDFRVTFQAGGEADHFQSEVTLSLKGEFRNRYLRELTLQVPLALNYRKRIAQGGDQGFRWDTRYFYQFFIAMHRNVQPHPDRNEWRLFSVEQETGNQFTIWRSEAENTAPIIMQQGSEAAGWTAVYDTEGGVLVALRDMASRAPCALEVDASGRGALGVAFQPRTQPARDMRCTSVRTDLFESSHIIDWIGFEGDGGVTDAEAALAEIWGRPLTSDSPFQANRESPMNGVEDLWKGPAAEGELSPMIQGGIPLPHGAVMSATAFQVFEKDVERALQTEPLAFWPDGSIKWIHVTFPMDDDPGLTAAPTPTIWERLVRFVTSPEPRTAPASAMLPIDVSLRDGGHRRYNLYYGSPAQVPEPPEVLRVAKSGGAIRVNTGPLVFSVRTGKHWLDDVRIEGQPVLKAGADSTALAHVEYLRMSETYPVRSRHPVGVALSGPVAIKQVKVEHAGPLYARLRLEGQSDGEEPARVIIRMEAWANRPWIQVSHTVEFLHADTRNTHLRKMGLTLPMAVDRAGTKLLLGGQDGAVASESTVAGLEQTSYLHYLAWAQQPGEAVELLDENRWSRGWLNVGGTKAGMLVVLQNMWQSHPKRLLADLDAGTVEVGLWPASAPLMDVRRYSNYPHRSQGESVPQNNFWVRDSYDQNEPFKGLSISHQMLLHFHGGDEPGVLDRIASDFQSRPLVYPGEAWLRETRISLPTFDPERFPGIDRNLNEIVDFWLYNQRIFGWYGMWNYGDVQHSFNRGYGWILEPEVLLAELEKPEEERFVAKYNSERRKDYSPQHNWAFDNGRWGWANTEGLMGLFLQNEYLRTGRRDVFFAAEAMSRHARDVVTRHAGRWFGSGTRHGVQPWSCGGHQWRQTIMSEYRFHHLLTGDARSRDVIERLVHESYLQPGRVTRHNNHGTVLYGLLTLWEITGDPALGDMLRRYAHTLIVPQGIAIEPVVKVPAIEVEGTPKGINSGNMMFHTFGGMHAMLETYYLTKDIELKDALVRMARAFVESPSVQKDWLKRGRGYPAVGKVLAFAAKHADDPAPFVDFLRQSLDPYDGWRRYFAMVGPNPEHWAGPTARPQHAGAGMKFWINSLPYVMTAFDMQPESSPEHLKRAADYAQNGIPINEQSYRNRLRERWQSVYDAPEFDAYLGRWRPWPPFDFTMNMKTLNADDGGDDNSMDDDSD